jgi:7-cyano-7-deazaguanine synthase
MFDGEKISKAVVLLSGGLDSTTLLHHVCRNLCDGDVFALSMAYGQKHERELEMARWQAEKAGVREHRVLDMGFMAELLKGGSALVDPDISVDPLDTLDRSELDQPPTYVPNRNMILLSVAAAWAESIGAGVVFYGAQAQDRYGYWDCTVEFVAKINDVIGLNRKNQIRVEAPFAELSKAELLRIGLDMGIDYSHTWSCYRGGESPCGECPTCVERARAFEELGIADEL